MIILLDNNDITNNYFPYLTKTIILMMYCMSQEYEQRMASAGLQVEQTTWRAATSTELETLKHKNEKLMKVVSNALLETKIIKIILYCRTTKARKPPPAQSWWWTTTPRSPCRTPCSTLSPPRPTPVSPTRSKTRWTSYNFQIILIILSIWYNNIRWKLFKF